MEAVRERVREKREKKRREEKERERGKRPNQNPPPPVVSDGACERTRTLAMVALVRAVR